jgi:hypothetical protein
MLGNQTVRLERSIFRMELCHHPAEGSQRVGESGLRLAERQIGLAALFHRCHWLARRARIIIIEGLLLR